MMLSELLLHRATTLKLHGVISHWNDISEDGSRWLEQFVSWEERYRSQRSLDGRLRRARIGRFKPITDFDWGWPTSCDRAVIEQWMQLGFMEGQPI